MLGGDGLQRLGLGPLDRVRMLTVEPGQKRLTGQHCRLAPGDAELGDETLAFSGYLALGVGGRVDDFAQKAQQLAKVRRQHRPDDGEPVGVDAC